MSSSKDNIYLNIVFAHDNSQGNAPTIARYNVTKTQPILSKASDYYCSVLRFDLPLDQIPLFVMPITNNPLNPNETALKIGIDNGLGQKMMQNIQFSSETTLSAPYQSPNDPYYYVYSITHLIILINLTLRMVYLAMYAGTSNTPPFFLYNPSTQLISLNVPTDTVGELGIGKIIINNELATYLDGFYLISRGNNLPSGDDFEFYNSY